MRAWAVDSLTAVPRDCLSFRASRSVPCGMHSQALAGFGIADSPAGQAEGSETLLFPAAKSAPPVHGAASGGIGERGREEGERRDTNPLAELLRVSGSREKLSCAVSTDVMVHGQSRPRPEPGGRWEGMPGACGDVSQAGRLCGLICVD